MEAHQTLMQEDWHFKKSKIAVKKPIFKSVTAEFNLLNAKHLLLKSCK